ncbi:ISL3 family transposase [Streptomyces mirabilis]|uniref:ISL3 family transposase n=1 Tax=Streptomyces mirabilis TaxID=68239 RepID=UPI002E27C341|nr:ISL3 family transposase [Streptomyces mirabilis]
MSLGTVCVRAAGVERTVVEGVYVHPVEPVKVVSVRPDRRWQRRPRCGLCRKRAPLYDRGHRRRWRSLDDGLLRVYFEADLPRVACPEHGVVIAAVPWARHGAGHTIPFDEMVAWFAPGASKKLIAVLLRINWHTVGSILARVMTERDGQDGDRLTGVRRIGIDEVSFAKGQKYLTVVVDHDTGRLLYVVEGRSKKTVHGFFDLLGAERARALTHVSADGAEWIAAVVGERAPNAALCLDPFHVVKWAQDALDEVRRQVWNDARRAGMKALTGQLKDARYALWKKPEGLTERQQAKLSLIQTANKPLYRAYLLKEQLRKVFAPGGPERVRLLDAWLAWACRSKLKPFVKLARTIRDRRADIANALAHRLTNARGEAMNTKIRLIIRRAYGFRSVEALRAMILLCLAGYTRPLPGRT